MASASMHRGFALLLAMFAVTVVATLGAGALTHASFAASALHLSGRDFQSSLILDGLEEAMTKWIEVVLIDPSEAPTTHGGFATIYEVEHNGLRVVEVAHERRTQG